MKLFSSVIFLFSLFNTYAQHGDVPLLERGITLQTENIPIEDLLRNISAQADFVFSYNPEVISHIHPLSLNVSNKPVRLVLNQIFKDGKVEYKVKGKYVILKRSGAVDSNKDNRLFEGYVYDSRTGKKLTQASVYDKTLLASAITDKYGYFSMELPANTPINSLQISKIGYADTLVISPDSVLKNRSLEIQLVQEDTIRKIPNFDFLKFKPGWLVPEKLKINAENITEPVFKSFQISLIPYLSTNKLLGGVAINDFP
ncbi:MAG: hypothetical protein HC830_02390 [Bacteroidetes bacterium]|nr:hypothetical protein [Bacteroidota bacterium]